MTEELKTLKDFDRWFRVHGGITCFPNEKSNDINAGLTANKELRAEVIKDFKKIRDFDVVMFSEYPNEKYSVTRKDGETYFVSKEEFVLLTKINGFISEKTLDYIKWKFNLTDEELQNTEEKNGSITNK